MAAMKFEVEDEEVERPSFFKDQGIRKIVKGDRCCCFLRML